MAADGRGGAPGAALYRFREGPPIRHQTIVVAADRQVAQGSQARVHRYRSAPPWAVAGLAGLAAAGAVLLTGGFAAAVDVPRAEGRAETAPAPAARIRPEAPVPAPPAAAPPAAAVAPTAPAGRWQVQVGAFSGRAAAEAHLAALATRVPGLSGLGAELRPSGALVRARIAGLDSRASARRLCDRVRGHGSGCFVVEPPPG